MLFLLSIEKNQSLILTNLFLRMKSSLLKGLIVFFMVLFTSMTYSQDVSGEVTDSSGPLPGATVLVKGTKQAVQTDFDGKYSIKNLGSNAVLVFSYIGLKSQEVSVAGRTKINVSLKTIKTKSYG